MDRSLKERVIGASVLVGLAVWLIPWVLDGPVQDAEVGAAQVPAAERSAPLRTRTIRLDDQPNSSAQAGAADIPGRPVPQGSEETPGGTLEVPAAAQPDASAAPAPIRTNAEVRVDASSGNAAVVSAGAPRENASEPNAAAAGTPSSTTSPTTAPAQTGPGWLVQVGNYGVEENARRQVGRMADAGFTARLYPHRSGGELMYRVRIGPEPSREGAEEIASSLRDRGFVVQVVSSD